MVLEETQGRKSEGMGARQQKPYRELVLCQLTQRTGSSALSGAPLVLMLTSNLIIHLKYTVAQAGWLS